jgi:hypothetical protein
LLFVDVGVRVPSREQRDVRKLIAIAASPDPVAAREEEKRETRERVRRIREERPYVWPVSQPAPVVPTDSDKLATIKRLFLALSDAEKEAFIVWTSQDGNY